MPRYQTGTRISVLRYMAECAIRDRVALIDAHTPPSYLPVTPESQAVIDDCRNCIADFRRLAGMKPAKR
jgi:hypothetical protein